MFDSATKSVKDQSGKLLESYAKLSLREKLIVSLGMVLAIFIGGYFLLMPVFNALEEQALAVEKANMEINNATQLLKDYARLKLKRQSIEQSYEKVEFQGDVSPYVESLVRDKIGEQPVITDSPAVPFGAIFERANATVKFSSQSYERLVELLKEMSQGKNPLLISRIDVRKSRAGDRLEVQLDVSSIRKAK